MTTTNNFFPTDPKKIRETIRRNERAFKAPHYDDGGGKRFLIGPLYLLMGEITGALKYYDWYKQQYPDDTPEAFNHLCWVLVLLRTEEMALAKLKFRELVFDNLYMIPLLLGESPKQNTFRHGSNWRELSFITEGPRDEIFSLVRESELSWIKKEWENAELVNDVNKYIQLCKILDEAEGNKERGDIIDQMLRVSKGKI